MCVCVCVCVRACMRVCVRICLEYNKSGISLWIVYWIESPRNFEYEFNSWKGLEYFSFLIQIKCYPSLTVCMYVRNTVRTLMPQFKTHLLQFTFPIMHLVQCTVFSLDVPLGRGCHSCKFVSHKTSYYKTTLPIFKTCISNKVTTVNKYT